MSDPDPNVIPPVEPEAPAGGTVKVDNQPTTPPEAPKTEEPTTPDFSSAVPDAYKDKPYMKEVDSFDKLFQDFDNAQSLIGQRQTNIPDKDATPEQWEEYFGKVRPESVDAYEFPETDFSKKFGRDEAFQSGMKELFHKAGLTPQQVNILAEGYDSSLMAQANEHATQAEQSAKDFEEKANQHFGVEKQQKLEIANQILKENTPKEFHEDLAKLPNESLLVMTSVLNNIHAKYMSEDNLSPNSPGSETSLESARAEAQRLSASPAYKDFRDPNHESTVKRVNELYDTVGKLSKKN